MSGSKYTFYTSAEYYRVLRERIRGAKQGDDIVLVSLWLRAEQPLIAEIVDELVAAAERGAKITLVLDAFNFLIKQGTVFGPEFYYGPRRMPAKLSKTFEIRRQAIERLKAVGISYSITNQTGRALANPFRGRSHQKYTIINDEVFLGGCNLGDPENIDVMVSWTDKRVAKKLRELTTAVMRTRRVSTAMENRDESFAIDKQTTLLIDAGVAHESIIMDAAYNLIDAAEKHLMITYQYFPHGPAAEHLEAAINRGVTLKAYYNHPAQHDAPLNLLYGSMARKVRKHGPPEFSSHRLTKDHPYLHAKVISSDNAVLLSSHNYMITGVELGTAEIGVYSIDPIFIAGVTDAFDRQLAAHGPRQDLASN